MQELRTWQKDWREENESIKTKVDDFWAKQMPGNDLPTTTVEPDTDIDTKHETVPTEQFVETVKSENIVDTAAEDKIIPTPNIIEKSQEITKN